MSVRATLTHRLSAAFVLDVDVEAPGGITILFGASGSGKSTLLRCIAGLTRAQKGRITLNDQTLFDTARALDVPPQQRHIGMVFQRLALFPHLTVQDNIGYGLARIPAGDRPQRIEAIAESFHITELLRRRPEQISGGERQRVALARTLVTEPSALLLDEPLAALDHRIQSRIIEDLRRWNDARRIPVLYVTHSHREVYALGERVIVLAHGCVATSGTPHDVLEHPGTEPMAQLAGFENLLAGRVIARRHDSGTMTVQIAGSPLTLEVPLVERIADDRLTVAIRAGDILVAAAAPRGLSARNVFKGRIEELQRHGPTTVARVAAGVPFVVHLTPASVDDLDLLPGAHVWLIIKTYSCRVAAG